MNDVVVLAIRRRQMQMRSMGRRVRQRRYVAAQVFPKAIERSYARFAFDYLAIAQRLVREVLVPQLARLALQRNDALRFDSPKAAKGIIDSLRRRSAGNEVLLEERIRDFGRRTAIYQGSQLQKQIRSQLSVEVPLRDRAIGPKLADWTTENVALIKSLPSETFDRIERIVLAGVNDGRRWEDMADEIEKRFDVARGRAQLIARDQVGKFYGAVNKARQGELGITQYRWRTSLDERVRPDHVAREGKLFSWDDPPEDGAPGQPINCRCTAEPDLSVLLDDL
jgi:SPP1 gp7 family putative phage head morphogenesis protein